MLNVKNKVEKDLIACVKGQKRCSEVKDSLNILQNVLTPRLQPGVGFVNGQLAVAPGHSVEMGAGVVGVTPEYMGYNSNGTFFANPSSAREFSGIPFNNGCNIVVISESEAKNMLKAKCKSTCRKLTHLQRQQFGGSMVNFMKNLVVYGPYMDKVTGKVVEGVDLDENIFNFIESVLTEYDKLPASEKEDYYKQWDLLAHGYDNTPDKWKQHKFNTLSQETKESFGDDGDVMSAWLCRLIKDAIFCFKMGKTEVNDGHTHKFNSLLDEIEKIAL